MPTDYNPIAEKYQRSKLQPWRTHVERFSLLERIGPVAGRSVVDLACGEGFYTRLLRERGASRVLGVDLSQRMVDIGRQQEAAAPLGVDYQVGDALKLALAETFDLVVAGWLLNYARDTTELAAMCQSVGRSLRPGGRFITVNMNPALDFRHAPDYRPYGFSAKLTGPWQPGATITWTFSLPDGDFSIDNYHLDTATHETALRAAGLTDIRWHRPQLNPAGLAEFGADFWTTLLEHPPMTILECVKR